VLGIVAVIGASAVQNLLRGRARRAEVIMLVAVAVVVVVAVALKFATRRPPRRAARKRS
jgi:hypothetical protein